MAVVLRRRVRVANPARRSSPLRRAKKNAARRKLTPGADRGRIRGEAGRQAAAKAARRVTRRNAAKSSKLAGIRRRPVRRNIGEIITIAGNPAAKEKKVAKGRKRKSTAVRRRSSARKNPSKRRTVVYMSKRRNSAAKHRRRRNPSRTAGLTSMIAKAGWTVGGLVGARAVTQLAFNLAKQPGANTGVIGYVGNVIAAFALGAVASKFKGREAGQAVTIGGLAGVVARAVAEFSPIGGFVKAQLSGMGDLGIYLPGQFGPPWVPVDSQTIAGAVQMQNPFPQPALPAPAKNGGVGRLGDVGSGIGGRYGTAGRYN